MSIFYPDFCVRKVTLLTPEKLASLGVGALLLDVDNTLTTHGNPCPYQGVEDWLESLRSRGFQLIIVSNNSEERVRPFAEKLRLPFVSRGAKPLPIGFWKAVKKLGCRREQAAVVGDQIFTDIVGGNLLGIATILITEITPEEGPFFRFKRRLERYLLKHHSLSEL